jgi:radical SAM protein with 4Fe4S-binding SPASM domain
MLYFYFIKKLNFSKLLNFFKIVFSYLISFVFKKEFYFGQPFSISIEPTNRCNLKCIECVSGQNKFTRKKGNLDFDLFQSLIDQIFKKALNCFIYFQGEPYLNSNFFDMVEYAHSKNIFVSTSTNGHFLDNQSAKKTVLSGLDKLIISLDGTNQDIYEKFRVGGDFEKVILGIKNLVIYKNEIKSKKPVIILQFLVLSINEHQVSEIKQLAKQLAVDKLEFKTVQIYNFDKNNYLLPKRSKYQRYKVKNRKYVMKNTLNNRCWRLWNSVVITWDGEVVPCCFDKDAKYSFGNLKSDSLQNILKGPNAVNFRNSILSKRKSIDICNNCTT